MFRKVACKSADLSRDRLGLLSGCHGGHPDGPSIADAGGVSTLM
jgi:hypothetical protein